MTILAHSGQADSVSAHNSRSCFASDLERGDTSAGQDFMN